MQQQQQLLLLLQFPPILLTILYTSSRLVQEYLLHTLSYKQKNYLESVNLNHYNYKMDMSGYGWSSGSESGWTGYLDESYNPRNDYNYNYSVHTHSYDVEEDMSMVSDASSGPQHLSMVSEEESYRKSGIENSLPTPVKLSKKGGGKKSKKSSGKEQKLSNHQNHLSYTSNNTHLDDTASSPALTYSKAFDNPSSCNQASVEHYMSYPQGISEAHFQESSSYTNHYGFWQPTLPKDTHSVEPSHLRGERWE